MQNSTSMKPLTGRAASAERRRQLVQGKSALPPASERSRTGERDAQMPAMTPAPAKGPTPDVPAAAGSTPPATFARARITGRLFSGDEIEPVGAESAGGRVTGDTPIHAKRVTGTQRGAERHITGTPYYRANVAGDVKTGGLERAASGFSVRPPQRESQLQADAGAVRAPSAAGRITGTFARGEGKITGNQEFNFVPRPAADHGARTKVTGEGRVEGTTVTGSAWTEKSNVTGTEDYIAAERNPSERDGQRHGFAGAGVFKGKGKHTAPTHHVTGMVGWSPKAAARVTVSGGAKG
jgi:hypothetical protein